VGSTIGKDITHIPRHIILTGSSPVCYTTARTRCIKQSHLEMCTQCNEPWSKKHNKECPYCLGARRAREKRLAKVEEEEDDEVMMKVTGRKK
jgi:hypothetical protein